MKNDEILIIVEPGVQQKAFHQLLLMVSSKTTYGRLTEGIRIGLNNLNVPCPPEWQLCNTIVTKENANLTRDERNEKTLRELGFVTGTVLNVSGKCEPWFFEQSKLISQLFNKRYKSEPPASRNTMKYNISNRMITETGETVIEVLSPGMPPQPPKISIGDALIPTLISFVTLYGFRALFTSSMQSSDYMLIYMGGSVLGTFGIQLFRHFRSNKSTKESRKKWKETYENYLERVCDKIELYQEQDVRYLNQCFPPMRELIGSIDNISGSLFSRCANDFDFMNLRFGNSDQIPSMFTIQHEVKEEIELGLTFTEQNGRIIIDPDEETPGDRRYLNELSDYLANEKYRFLTETAEGEYPRGMS